MHLGDLVQALASPGIEGSTPFSTFLPLKGVVWVEVAHSHRVDWWT
jgi:hypothetical protein